MFRRSPGFTLYELLIAIAVIGLFVSISLPQLHAINRKAAVRGASTEIRNVFHLARSRAIARGASVGVKFTFDGVEWFYAVYDDGDGDGVRSDDIRSGVDRCFRPKQRLLPHATKYAAIALPSKALLAPDGGKLAPSSSPVRFGASAICSFSPIGESSPGTIYLTDDAGEVWCVRVYGGSARIRLLRHMGGKRWDAR